MQAKSCDQCQKPIEKGTGFQAQETLYLLEYAEPADDADTEILVADLCSEDCARAYLGDRRKAFLDRFLK